MNGAESLVRTLVTGGVEVCFANPGTSEMHFVAALDRVDGVRCVLCLFEGVATGAADGYARMAEKPAATLLHLGPGLANGLANLHNAKRARSPVVNIVGDHAAYHRPFDLALDGRYRRPCAPLCGLAPRTSADSQAVAERRRRSDRRGAGGARPDRHLGILPGGYCLGRRRSHRERPRNHLRERWSTTPTSSRRLRPCAQAGQRFFLLGDRALRSRALDCATGIAEATGARLLAETSNARVERGAGRAPIARLPYPVDAALTALADFERVILVGARAPVAFFAYPGKPSELTPSTCRIHTLAAPQEDQFDALIRLADAVGARYAPIRLRQPERRTLPRGRLDGETIAAALGALLPENAIVCDESVTTGRNFFAATAGAEPHDWLQLSGGAIGLGIPMAVGAALACPDRKVVSLQADGSGMYTLQGLWTQAREKLNVLTVIWANRSYAILRGELANVGAENPGPKALDMLSLSNPAIDWTSLARGLGVEACRVETIEDFVKAFQGGLAATGPFLIEVVL